MKPALHFCLIGFVIFVSSCERESMSPGAVELTIDFSWNGIQPCGWGNPEILVSGVPAKTKFLKISMYDHVHRHDHGSVLATYNGSGIITKDRFRKIQGPCPPGSPGRYEIKIKAINESEEIIGFGSKERFFPEEE